MATKARGREDGPQDYIVEDPSILSGSASTIQTQQQIPSIKATDDRENDKPVAYKSRTPIADEFMNGAFRSKIFPPTPTFSQEPVSVEQADVSHSPTDMYTPGPPGSREGSTTSKAGPAGSSPTFPSPPTTPQASILEPKVTTPQSALTHVPVRGYRFEVNNIGDIISSSSSVSTERSTQPKRFSSGASSPRRDNPKAYGPNGGRESTLQVPDPKADLVFDIVTEYHGLKLCRVSDAVPYLLGTRNLRARLASITEDKLSHTPSIRPGKISCGSPDTYSSLDLSLMAILHTLRNASSSRQALGNWYAQGLAARNDSLILYEHTAATGPEQILVSAAKFQDMAQTWLHIRNPSNMSGDPPNAINAWVDIVTDLRKQEVDIRKIDTKLYYELTTELEGEALQRRIAEIVRWSRNRHLDQRYEAWCRHVEGTKKVAATAANQHTGTAAGTNQQDTRRDCLYTKRFSHAHPLGLPTSPIPSSPAATDKKAQRHAEKAARAFAAATAAALETQRQERLDERKGVVGGVWS
ncbi:hypothetical protein ACET3X_008805 [Alternaria dauci]|uniref:Uncharacterized protein n=1 Tax=Alternaria dauci TaxID=48095 RepID=A0ABR3U8J9_9PLEO